MSNLRATAAAVAVAMSMSMTWSAAAAGGGESGWQVRAYGAWVDPDLDGTVLNDDGQPIGIKGDTAFGYGFGLGYRASRHVSWSADLLRVAPEVALSAGLAPGIELRAVDRLQVTPLLLGMGWHLTPDRSVDVAVGPVVGWVAFGDMTFEVGDEQPFRAVTENKSAYGARLSASTALGGGAWSLVGDVTYLQVDLEARDGNMPRDDSREFSFDPLIVTFGVGYRF